VNKMKKLSKQIGEEHFLETDYINVRLMNEKKAWTSSQIPFFTIKKIQEKGVHKQMQFHIRFPSRNGDNVDIDFYITVGQFKKLTRIDPDDESFSWGLED